ncbi:MAG: CbiX/SirB N-terminal domain-containing protein [Burkholderiales bacterium]|nr:CbiX/SirB N-terminal domain-containing protein [Burkholderiales bacterium]
MEAIIVFAHGARDPEWARPFETLCDAVRVRRPGTLVRLAYLEFMTPTLADAVESLALAGAGNITIVPAFMAQGGHLKRDVPELVAAARARHPGTSIRLTAPLGEVPAVIDAMARHIAP